jgi:hypothetical protein
MANDKVSDIRRNDICLRKATWAKEFVISEF